MEECCQERERVGEEEWGNLVGLGWRSRHD